MTYGEAAKAARLRAGLSQCELAKRAGIGHNQISLLERDKRPQIQLFTVELLADALGISIDEYIGHKVKKIEHTF